MTVKWLNILLLSITCECLKITIVGLVERKHLLITNSVLVVAKRVIGNGSDLNASPTVPYPLQLYKLYQESRNKSSLSYPPAQVPRYKKSRRLSPVTSHRYRERIDRSCGRNESKRLIDFLYLCLSSSIKASLRHERYPYK